MIPVYNTTVAKASQKRSSSSNNLHWAVVTQRFTEDAQRHTEVF
jgi:hypothetical protein